jgi:hypothetical protein
VSRITARWGVVLAVVVSSASGCFRYIPTQVNEVPPGENVRLYVNRNVVESLGEVSTMSEPVLRGQVVRRDETELFLRIPVATRQVGFHSEELGQDVNVRLSDIIAVERRRLDRIGTGALVAGTAGAAAVVLFVIMEAFGERETVEECPDCEELLTPLISIPIR